MVYLVSKLECFLKPEEGYGNQNEQVDNRLENIEVDQRNTDTNKNSYYGVEGINRIVLRGHYVVDHTLQSVFFISYVNNEIGNSHKYFLYPKEAYGHKDHPPVYFDITTEIEDGQDTADENRTDIEIQLDIILYYGEVCLLVTFILELSLLFKVTVYSVGYFEELLEPEETDGD